MRVTGKMVKCMGWALSNWVTDDITREASLRTRSKGTVSTAGVMGVCTWGPGKLENSTASVFLCRKMADAKEVNGKTANASHG